MSKTEYRVRPVTRYAVTAFTRADGRQSSSTIGEFPNEEQAEQVAAAMASHTNARAFDMDGLALNEKHELARALLTCIEVIQDNMDRDDSGVMEAVCGAEDMLQRLGYGEQQEEPPSPIEIKLEAMRQVHRDNGVPDEEIPF